MEKKGKRRRQQKKLELSAMAALIFLFFSFTLAKAKPQQQQSFQQRMRRNLVENNNKPTLSRDVTLEWQNHGQVVIDNGLVRVTLSRPDGNVIGLKYKGIDNVLEIHNAQHNRGYWDVVWNRPNRASATDRVRATEFKVITVNSDQIELSFTKTWDPSDSSSLPLNIDKRYILRRGDYGFYSYGIFERLDGWPQIDVDQIRIVYKLQGDKFHYMAISDNRQRIMPTLQDRLMGRPLAYPEAVLLTRPINSNLKGEVDDKYQYSLENMENKVHGWESSEPHVGFWMITSSDEFRTAGPVKQDLTSHVGPTTLSMFVSTHYAGKEVSMRFGEGEAWKKVFGPVFTYLNSDPTGTGSLGSLWEDAKNQMRIERSKWPYNFVESGDFPSSDQRGTVSGRLLVRDRYAKNSHMWADSAYVGLAAPGESGSWQKESKGYQFWTRADEQGYFSIDNIRPGNYNLYAWVPGVVADYKYDKEIIVTPRSSTNLNLLVFHPPRQGPTLWEIGVPDRTAAEFYIPNPQPTLMNRFYNNSKFHTQDNFRQYGLWEQYSELYPNQDLVYNVTTDNYRRHWFFAHVTRATTSDNYEATTWQIVFRLQGPKQTGNYMLRLALASSTDAVVDIRFNNPSATRPHFSTGYWSSGKDNAIARHGIHGLYWLFNFQVPSQYLVEDENVIYLTQRRHTGPFQGVMYDYIRFEGVE
ncbi:probable rhamnogalacturonate lyase B [Benincasa hispida]|uniref:probable rhamnogalacturonate lyase B n=1 Tax=Benincasa hispida TaxID=102211 RepID=UPI0018FF761F|nr:probable rhamnogalacturonate lyase B [Benincasa hispida]